MHWTALLTLLSHWRRSPIQLLTLVLGIAAATALWSAVQTINGEARASYSRAAAVLSQNQLPQLAREDGARFSQDVFVTLRKGGWLVSPILEGERRFAGLRLRVLGFDPMTLPIQAQQIDLSSGADLGDFVSGAGVVYAAPETAKKITGAIPAVVRELASLPSSLILTDIGKAQELLNAPDKVSRLVLWSEQPRDQQPLKDLSPELRLIKPIGTGDLDRLTDSFHLNLTAFGYLSFAVGLFIVHATIGLAFEQRRNVFRTLRAIGLPARDLIVMLLGELVVFALAAGLLGIGVGHLIAAALLPDVAATLQSLYGASIDGSNSLRGASVAAGLGIAVFGTLIAAAQGLWKVMSLPVLASAQPQAWVGAAKRVIKLQTIAAAVLFTTATAIAIFGTGLIWSFALLAALLLGSALMLPSVLMVMLKLGERLSTLPVAQWFWADTRQQMSGLSLSLMALLLALAANIGVGTMVSSFRQTFVGWLDQRLAAEVYVSARSEPEARAIETWLKPRADAILPIWNVEAKIDQSPVAIFGVADDATYRNNWPLLAMDTNAWDQLAHGGGVFVNEQLARRKAYKIGALITLPDNWQTRVVGIYSDYGNTAGQVMIGLDQLVKRFPDVARLRFAIRTNPSNAAALARDLRAEFDLPEQNLIDQAAIKALSVKTFERTFTVTAALNVLTLGVAALSMFTSLLTLSAMRLSQVAPVWALGLTRFELAKLELGRSVLLAMFTAIAALPVGLGLAWVLLAVVNVEAFGWRLPMYLFPSQWFWLGALALLAAVLAAALPALRLARLSPALLLKVFADER
jgi:putative ABC transport system permease protein